MRFCIPIGWPGDDRRAEAIELSLIHIFFTSFIRQIQQNFSENVVRYFRPLKIGLSKVVDPIAQWPIEFWRNYNLGWVSNVAARRMVSRLLLFKVDTKETTCSPVGLVYPLTDKCNRKRGRTIRPLLDQSICWQQFLSCHTLWMLPGCSSGDRFGKLFHCGIVGGVAVAIAIAILLIAGGDFPIDLHLLFRWQCLLQAQAQACLLYTSRCV